MPIRPTPQWQARRQDSRARPTIHDMGMVARDLLEWRPKRVVNGPHLVALVRALWWGPGLTNDPFGAPSRTQYEPNPLVTSPTIRLTARQAKIRGTGLSF
jgi:hypothetical protein